MGCGAQEQFYGCADIAIGNHTLPDSVTLPYWKDVYDKYSTTPNFDKFTNKPKRKPQREHILRRLIQLLKKYPKVDIKKMLEKEVKMKTTTLADIILEDELPTQEINKAYDTSLSLTDGDEVPVTTATSGKPAPFNVAFSLSISTVAIILIHYLY